MSPLGRRLVRGISSKVAQTVPDDVDPRLRGRTYSIPFQEVWAAALELANRRGWRVTESDDQEGLIQGEARSLLLRWVADVEVRIGLDENGQTRVDLRSSSRRGFADLGRNARRIGRFLRRLDKAIARKRKQKAKQEQAQHQQQAARRSA